MHAAKTKTRQFLNPEKLLVSIPLTPGLTVADFGCGNGYYSVAAGAVVGPKGQVFALDVMDDALSQTATLAKLTGVHNVSTHQCDLEKLGSSGIADGTCDVVIISGLMHQAKSRENVLREAYRVLKTGGKLLVVEWLPESPFGPEHTARVPKNELQALLEKYSFRPVSELPAGSFHYALLYGK